MSKETLPRLVLIVTLLQIKILNNLKYENFAVYIFVLASNWKQLQLKLVNTEQILQRKKRYV